MNYEISVRKIIEDEIRTKGEIPFYRFMELSLYGPGGYYNSGRVKIGTKDQKKYDFTTTPEDLSPFYGEGIARFIHAIRESVGKPQRLYVVEMGPGNATLARDTLDALGNMYPNSYDAVEYVLVERSKGLIPEQKRKLEKHRKTSWIHGSALTDIPQLDLAIAISNELPDSFPVHIVENRDGDLQEVYITEKNGTLVEVLGPLSNSEIEDYLRLRNDKVKQGTRVAINTESIKWYRNLSRRIRKGSIVTIDYGYDGELKSIEPRSENIPSYSKFPGYTSGIVRYPKGIRYEDMLNMPGEVDITSDVDFKILREIGLQEGWKELYYGPEKFFSLMLMSHKFEGGSSLSPLRNLSALIHLKDIPMSFEELEEFCHQYKISPELPMWRTPIMKGDVRWIENYLKQFADEIEKDVVRILHKPHTVRAGRGFYTFSDGRVRIDGASIEEDKIRIGVDKIKGPVYSATKGHDELQRGVHISIDNEGNVEEVHINSLLGYDGLRVWDSRKQARTNIPIFGLKMRNKKAVLFSPFGERELGSKEGLSGILEALYKILGAIKLADLEKYCGKIVPNPNFSEYREKI